MGSVKPSKELKIMSPDRYFEILDYYTELSLESYWKELVQECKFAHDVKEVFGDDDSSDSDSESDSDTNSTATTGK